MNPEEQVRLETLNRVLAKELCVKDAARLLAMSERHTWRLLAAYRKHGAAALAHGGRGRKPAHALAECTKEQVITLARTVYAGANHTHLTELLAEREGLVLSRSTVRRILVQAGIPSPRRRRPPRSRLRRERLPQEGMLLQIDGSDHDWLEDRGPRMCLLLAVDDATGKVPWALFRPNEDSHGYFVLLQGIIERHGVPLSLYSDRHSVFRKARRSRKAARTSADGGEEPTQFGRAMRELGMIHVLAWSPEGKGRVERIAGTFQDRLVTELRLAGTRTLEEANEVLSAYLPRFNGRFSVPAAQPGSAYREVPTDVALQDVLCFKHRRKVARDNTVQYRWRILQLIPEADRRSNAGLVVEVREHLDGHLTVCYKGQLLNTQEIPHPRSVFREGTQGQNVPTDWAGLTERLTKFLPSPHEISTPPAADGRKPTPRAVAYWEAIHEARNRGLGIKAIARELGISRTTVRKYIRYSHPPVRRKRSAQQSPEEALTFSLTSSP